MINKRSVLGRLQVSFPATTDHHPSLASAAIRRSSPEVRAVYRRHAGSDPTSPSDRACRIRSVPQPLSKSAPATQIVARSDQITQFVPLAANGRQQHSRHESDAADPDHDRDNMKCSRNRNVIHRFYPITSLVTDFQSSCSEPKRSS